MIEWLPVLLAATCMSWPLWVQMFVPLERLPFWLYLSSFTIWWLGLGQGVSLGVLVGVSALLGVEPFAFAS